MTFEKAQTTPDLRSLILSANVWQDGHYIFANGGHGLVKLEMDNLWHHPEALTQTLHRLATVKDVPPPDVILGVPSGGQRLANEMKKRKLLDIPVIQLQRIPRAGKRDFMFASNQDRERALAAKSLRIYEDVVSTLSSIAGVVKLLEPSRQEIHSVSIWRRGKPLNKYSKGFKAHYLIEEEIPIYSEKDCPYCNQKTL